ncbi:MAG: RNA methyltransferase, partial [Lentisphaeria bacterium]|nr:RNA methyltransferase [Lentisphaeria bacterium]
MIITSLQNPKIKNLVKLRTRKQRDKQQLYIIEGYRALLRAMDHGHSPDELYICPELFIGSNETALIERIEESGTDILELSPEAFKKVAYRERPEGLMAVAKQFHPELDDFTDAQKQLIITGEAIEKPGNLGTM